MEEEEEEKKQEEEEGRHMSKGESEGRRKSEI